MEAAAAWFFWIWEGLGAAGVLGLGGTFGIPVWIFMRGWRRHRSIRMRLVALMMIWLEYCMAYQKEVPDRDLVSGIMSRRQTTIYDMLLAHADSFKIDSITDITEGMNEINVCIDNIKNDSGGAAQAAALEEYIDSVMDHLRDNYPREYKEHKRHGKGWSITDFGGQGGDAPGAARQDARQDD
ncbi:MAG: hypothetical protein MPJ78_19360 [Hyphomicrobiaceae bacterium]|nr:hypothetical protein [Hyphomicrobiaceae bacterium]